MNDVQHKVIHRLTSIELAVLKIMAVADKEDAPFEAATLARYRLAAELSGQAADEIRVDVPNVQQALLALQEKKLVWRAARGVYAIEEQTVIDLLRTGGMLDGL
jgi:hypothetical protein